MKITYDGSANAAYLYLRFPILPGEAKKTYCCDPVEVGGTVNLDFDASDRLIGIEELDASHKLPPELLRMVETIG